jgi:hypothetical protein
MLEIIFFWDDKANLTRALFLKTFHPVLLQIKIQLLLEGF